MLCPQQTGSSVPVFIIIFFFAPVRFARCGTGSVIARYVLCRRCLFAVFFLQLSLIVEHASRPEHLDVF